MKRKIKKSPREKLIRAINYSHFKMKTLIIFFTVMLLLLWTASAFEDIIDLNDYKLVYSYADDDAVSGETFTLKISIENTGEDKNNIDIMFDDGYPFSMNDDDWSIENLSSGTKITRIFRVEIDEDASEKKYMLPFDLEDDYDDFSDELEIKVSSGKPRFIIGSITSQPIVIAPDTKEIKLTVNIENAGAEARLVQASLKLPDGFSFPGSYTSLNLGTFQADGSKNADFYIDTDKDLAPGDFKAILELSYEDDSGNSLTKNLEVLLPVKGKPQFEIIEGSIYKLEPGSTKEIRISIKNTGSITGDETSIRVFESTDVPFTFGEKTRRIGTLEPGESGTGVFTVEVDKNARPNVYYLKVQIRTIDNGNVLVTEDSLPVEVIEGKGRNYLLIFLIVLMAAVAGLVFYYFYFRRIK